MAYNLTPSKESKLGGRKIVIEECDLVSVPLPNISLFGTFLSDPSFDGVSFPMFRLKVRALDVNDSPVEDTVPLIIHTGLPVPNGFDVEALQDLELPLEEQVTFLQSVGDFFFNRGDIASWGYAQPSGYYQMYELVRDEVALAAFFQHPDTLPAWEDMGDEDKRDFLTFQLGNGHRFVWVDDSPTIDSNSFTRGDGTAEILIFDQLALMFNELTTGLVGGVPELVDKYGGRLGAFLDDDLNILELGDMGQQDSSFILVMGVVFMVGTGDHLTRIMLRPDLPDTPPGYYSGAASGVGADLIAGFGPNHWHYGESWAVDGSGVWPEGVADSDNDGWPDDPPPDWDKEWPPVDFSSD